MMVKVQAPREKLIEIQQMIHIKSADLARSIGVHPVTMSRYLSGLADPDAAVTARIDAFYRMCQKLKAEEWFKKLMVVGTIGGILWLLLNDYNKK
jgi:DNA transposition AAA+ family ATPase